jgi:hypothetical protein
MLHTCVFLLLSGTLPAQSSAPDTHLYDAPATLTSPLTADRFAAQDGWTTLAEDDTAHRFQGCAVLANDKLAAVLVPGTAEIAVYSRQLPGLPLCARLQPLCPHPAQHQEASWTIRENSLSSVAIDVELRGGTAESCAVSYELAAGAAYLRTTRRSSIEKLRVQAPCRHAILPDFFGDDILVDAAAIPVPRAELPSENFLLHMLHGGNAIVMTVAEARGDDMTIGLSNDPQREITHTDVAFGNKPNIWVAVLAEKQVWHERTVALSDAGNVLRLDWRAPFVAMWRVDWRAQDGLTDSWEMLLQHPEGKYIMPDWFGQDAAAGQRFGPELGDRDWNKPGRRRWNPVLGSFAFPCWIDQDGSSYLQPLKERRYTERGEVCNFSGPAIIYPLDRAKTPPFTTPLEKLTVVDLVRMTLGVGPCEYILDLEGQKRNSRGVATCYARDVITAIYRQNTQLQQGPTIDEQLTAAVAFIRNVRERIDQYVVFGHEMVQYLEEQKRRHPQHAAFCDELLTIARKLDQFFAQKQQAIRTPEYAQQTADRFRQQLMTYTGSDAFQQCEEQMRIFTSIGGAQDGLVASCRMVVKTLRQRAGLALATQPELQEIAGEVRNRTQAILRNPTAYEAPQH